MPLLSIVFISQKHGLVLMVSKTPALVDNIKHAIRCAIVLYLGENETNPYTSVFRGFGGVVAEVAEP